jgi:hypothetical protein
MAVVNGYTTRAQLQEHFGDTITALDVDLLDRAITASSRAIDRFCGRRFWIDAAVVARQYRPGDAGSVFVDDIATRTGVVVKTDTTGDGTYATTWDSTDFDLEPRNADVVAAGSTGDAFSFWQITAIDDKTFPLSDRRATLHVTAKFGWSAVPVDVEEACLLKAASLFKRKDAPFGVAGFGDFGVVRIRRDSDVGELLNPYVRYSRPEV